MRHQRAHVRKQLLGAMAKDALLNLDGDKGPEEQAHYGEGEKPQQLLPAAKSPHMPIRWNDPRNP